ncbi:ComF family protein [Vibrio algarum]|uniref:ComF family protein n=1 Tax=Vibrio algarum TaxID=3020714 RepID=A0ABT4YN47_9VIBR|nr:ComF family protein [Vibrio sp. KJ40-1]MDB1122489.1 ComF family protein [Vibrio sp. KJ40-1]
MWGTKLRRYITRHSNPVCHLCGLTKGVETKDIIWCHNCLSLFSAKPRCYQCGLETLAPVAKCGSCLTEPPLWDRLFCVGDYRPPLSNYIYNLKYSGGLKYGYDLSYLLSKRIDNPAPLIASMPLHWQRFFHRGYNQSDVLGNYLATHLQSQPVFTSQLFKRIKSTPSQQGLNKEQRMKNLKHAFTLNWVPNQTHIAIIDDVVTTGSSVRQLCALLLDVGVKKLIFIVSAEQEYNA